MRTFFTALFLIAMGLLTLLPSLSFAQAPDTMVVAALPPGNLNMVINGDTSSTGQRNNPNRVYVLQQTGALDTVYFLSNQIQNVPNLTIVGKVNPTTGNIPVIEPYLNPDGSTPGSFATCNAHSFVKFVNLFLLGTRSDGSQVTQQCISPNGDTLTYIMDHCIFENFGSSGTPNILNTWSSAGDVIKVSHCLFKDNQSSVPQNPGMNWSGPAVNGVDTMIVTNSSFFVMGGNICGSGTSIGYFKFDHNTIFMHTKSSPFSCRGMGNAIITNNIFYSCYSAGLDSNHAFNTQVYNANFYGLPAIFTLDSLQTGENRFTEATRVIDVENNAYFWPKGILYNFNTLNSDPQYQAVGGHIYSPVFMSVRPGAEAILQDPGIKFVNNDSTDPGFDPTLVAQAVDSMTQYVQYVWKNGGSGLGDRPFVGASDPLNPFNGVPANWQTTQGYDVPQNLRYTNAALLTAANGLPLGDLTWWPDKTTGVEQIPNSVPSNYTLSQNYPNPFNPSTLIEYSIPKGGFVTVKVYNLLGQEVATLVNQEQRAGSYKVDFDATKLASGVYMYQLHAGNFNLTKKMILMK
ncbi:MAG: T9SS type A sorting domain-containing protein [Bacteroidetes bacterium]|nr:T9SS type A sorting domain-containing protein [Bacteroidota bacterium]